MQIQQELAKGDGVTLSVEALKQISKLQPEPLPLREKETPPVEVPDVEPVSESVAVRNDK